MSTWPGKRETRRNKYLYRLQQNFPILNVLITGNIPRNDNANQKYYVDNLTLDKFKYYETIGETIENLAKDKNVIMFFDRPEESGALAEKYALENKFEYFRCEAKLTLSGCYQDIKATSEIAKNIDLIILTGDKGRSKENIFKIPIRMLEIDSNNVSEGT